MGVHRLGVLCISACVCLLFALSLSFHGTEEYYNELYDDFSVYSENNLLEEEVILLRGQSRQINITSSLQIIFQLKHHRTTILYCKISRNHSAVMQLKVRRPNTE